MKRMKIFLIRFLVALLAFQGVIAAELLTASSVHAANSSVVINELMWMGSTASSADEWVELKNTTAASIDLAGWKLTNAATGGSDLTITSGTIPANGLFLISNYNQNSTSSVLNVVPDLVTTSISLSNTCAQISLVQSDASVADSMGCDGSSYFAGENTTTKRAMERNIAVTDGTLSASWHSSVGFINLDAGAAPNNFATPVFINDASAANDSAAVVNDGAGADIDWSADSNAVSANWSGFTDPESGITDYMVGLGTTPTNDDFVAFASAGAVNSHSFTFPGSTTSGKFYVLVKPVNGAGTIGAIKASDGFTVDINNPVTPTNLAVSDVPGDNGGAVKATWSASTSVDDIKYQLNYRRVGDATWTVINAGAVLEATVSGLQNAPTRYEFTVEAIDFNNQHSVPSAAVIGQALDNLAPIIDANKVVVSQNKPGLADTVAGLAGASNEVPVTVTLLSAPPGDPTAIVINSAASNPDGSWPSLGIGDNAYAKVWLQLTDASGNLSLPLVLTNDIAGPTPPVLDQAVANCQSATCRVTLSWQAGSTDTVSYKVNYVVDGINHETFEVTSTSMSLDLTSGKSYQFKVVGYDQYGNSSVASNIFTIMLVTGVKTTVKLVDGTPVTTTEAISGAREVTKAAAKPSPPAQFIPKAQAAAPATEQSANIQQPLVQDSTNSHDWIRIFVVVILLLVIAGSFYALSRSVGETPEEADKAWKSQPENKPATKRRRRRRRK